MLLRPEAGRSILGRHLARQPSSFPPVDREQVPLARLEMQPDGTLVNKMKAGGPGGPLRCAVMSEVVAAAQRPQPTPS
jgi:hypothetical protein